MFPFTVDDVVNAYQQTGLKASSLTWYNGVSACGLGALFVQRIPETTIYSISNTKIEQAFNITGDECESFSTGFDDGCLGKEHHSEKYDQLSYNVGYHSALKMRAKQNVRS